jgi:hypothetical protein
MSVRRSRVDFMGRTKHPMDQTSIRLSYLILGSIERWLTRASGGRTCNGERKSRGSSALKNAAGTQLSVIHSRPLSRTFPKVDDLYVNVVLLHTVHQISRDHQVFGKGICLMLLVSGEHGHALWDFEGHHRPLLIRPVESRDLERDVALVQVLITTLSPRNQSTRELTNLRELPHNDGEKRSRVRLGA